MYRMLDWSKYKMFDRSRYNMLVATLMAMTHMRRLVTLKPVIQYPRKDMLAPSSSTANGKTKVLPDKNSGDEFR